MPGRGWALVCASRGAKDSLMLISLHLSPWAASCLPQLLIHFYFSCAFLSPSPSPFVVIFSACFFLSPYFPLQNCSLPPTWQDKMGMWRKWPFPLFATTLASNILFFSLHNLFLLCVYECLNFTCCLEEDKSMRLYNKENKDLGERQREERGRPLWEVQLVENLQTCQFQLVHSGLWTQHFYFPCPLRERQMFCLSALQLKLFPRCSRPFEASQWAN